MSDLPTTRRDAIKQMGVGAVALALPGFVLRRPEPLIVAGQPAELTVSPVSALTVRLTVRATGSQSQAIPFTGALVRDDFGRAALRSTRTSASARVGDVVVTLGASSEGRPSITVKTSKGAIVQLLTLDAALPGMTFRLPTGSLLGLGEGGAQFDRKGIIDQMRNGQSAYRLATHGTRAPVQWLIGTDGWAMFIHQPYGAFDLTGTDGKFTPTILPPTGNQLVNSPNPVESTVGLPLDVFVVASKNPEVIMREYARITGLPEMPARWTLGYQQSHRTLAGPSEIMGVARTLREKKLPCDTLIYLGTEFTPSGWNTRNGEFTWHPTNFPEPKKMLDELHAEHFKVVLHTVIEGRRLTGTVSDPCTASPLPSGRTADNQWPPDRQVSCYWPIHKSLMDVGVDGWWPDQGDGYDGPSRFARHRMYWEGTQMYRPNDRPYALHRNASPGIQRYGGFIWSGDVQSRWETLKQHVAIGVNSGLSGFPLWGTDIGGFYGTAEYTGELWVRWFQFGAFCPLFRSHGRNWHLHTPWGWDGGDGGPNETSTFTPDPSELHNAQVEPICRKYLELRYRLMPYLYTVVRDAQETGMPVMRALWLHHADDPSAVARGDEYLWGRDILVAPVFEKGATTRRLYLPKGDWYDFWTNERVTGGREVERPVDLATLPLYVRAGAVIATGPVRQYVDEPSSEPMTLTVYPGVDGTSSWYDDDGHSFDYRRGEWMRVVMQWREKERRLTLRLAPRAKMMSPLERRIVVRVSGSSVERSVVFSGMAIDVRL
ncbi:MAG: TIM-barrel domain-containing protein [bacterium]